MLYAVRFLKPIRPLNTNYSSKENLTEGEFGIQRRYIHLPLRGGYIHPSRRRDAGGHHNVHPSRRRDAVNIHPPRRRDEGGHHNVHLSRRRDAV